MIKRLLKGRATISINAQFQDKISSLNKLLKIRTLKRRKDQSHRKLTKDRCSRFAPNRVLKSHQVNLPFFVWATDN